MTPKGGKPLNYNFSASSYMDGSPSQVGSVGNGTFKMWIFARRSTSLKPGFASSRSLHTSSFSLCSIVKMGSLSLLLWQLAVLPSEIHDHFNPRKLGSFPIAGMISFLLNKP